MGSGAARVGGADPGARRGRTRGTLKRRTGCPGSAPRFAARPIPPHPRRPPPSALDFNPFKTKKIVLLYAVPKVFFENHTQTNQKEYFSRLHRSYAVSRSEDGTLQTRGET